ncbi:class I SAM-dependent methyltransferase [Lacibacter luteus]|uniref:Class I SAM-dependent methyltransferase n=1 Tax=Lacibacter luteus TaxID=2508719 RepID=A0A4Q1CMV9_9BACT|nr:class I SAM-dependent methyltransferase [Lacibacter luteus]RXK61949.1 class I SAM-dependent methyltransferase [Lacibacter luteus]
MEEALQRRVQRYGWDKAAQYYETLWQQQLKPAHNSMFALAQISVGEKIIDTACGTGLISFRALEATGVDGYVLGTDISDKMIELCMQVAKMNKSENCRFERMDAELLVAGDGEFDVSLCALGLMYMPNPVRALQEMFRVIKHGGRCVVSVWGKRPHCGWASIFEIVDKRVTSEVCPMFFNLGNDGMLERSMKMAGFSDIVLEKINTHLQYKSAEEACAAAFEGGPVALAYHKFSDVVKKEVCEEYLQSIEAYKHENGYTIPGEFVIGKGSR